MVKFYAERIKNGKITLDEVPKKWHEQVKEYLENQ